MHPFTEILSGFLHLLYPVLCVGCERENTIGNSCFCLRCKLNLEPAGHLSSRENEFTQRFWGRLPVDAGASMYVFHRKNPIQKALHHLKYKNKPDIGIRLGREFGTLLARSEFFQPLDAVVPIPLHPLKEKQRGYNQSAMFGQGIAESMQIPLLQSALLRGTYTETQTQKKRMDRFNNVASVFYIAKPQLIRRKHILLVDDVLTTGATLEAAGIYLQDADAASLRMATIALALTQNY